MNIYLKSRFSENKQNSINIYNDLNNIIIFRIFKNYSHMKFIFI